MKDPKSKDEARKKRYGCWGGQPNGHAYQEGRCIVEIYPSGRGEMHRQCNRKDGYGPDKAYCKQHDPEEVAKRDKISRERFEAEMRDRGFAWHGRKFYGVLKKIADGHNDPRSLAQETIDEFEATYK